MSQIPTTASSVLYCKEGHEPVAVVAGGQASCVLYMREYCNVGWISKHAGEPGRA